MLGLKKMLFYVIVAEYKTGELVGVYTCLEQAMIHIEASERENIQLVEVMLNDCPHGNKTIKTWPASAHSST